jgi:hypothetical protein
MTRAPRPWHFFFLFLPYGASFGFVSVAVPFLAKQRGVSVEATSAVVAAAFAPHAIKFLWAPLVDTTLTRRTWYALAIALVAGGTLVSMAAPIRPDAEAMARLTSVIVASQLGLTLLGMSCEGMIGHGFAPERKGAASAWFQSGIFLGTGVGGGAAIELVTRLGGTAGGAILAAAFLACALPLLAFDEPPDPGRARPVEALRALPPDLWALARSRSGIAALLICLSPVGAGAASNLFGAIADEWHASTHTVALTTGALGSVVGAAGAASGAWLARRVTRLSAYALAGALTAATALAMAAAPATEASYVGWTLLYSAFNGLAFASFSAFAFDSVGRGAVATKYNVLASLANTATLYATRIDGRAHTRWGGRGLLVTDAAMTFAGIAALAAAAWLARARGSAKASDA